MCREAVRLGKRVGVMATLPTTLEPTKGTVARVAREMGTHVELVDCLVDGAFGLDQAQFKQRLTDAAREIIDQVDVIVLAQGSMAYAEEQMTEGDLAIHFLSTKGTLPYGHPYTYAKTLNARLLEQNHLSGWIVLDFFNAALAQQIYSMNF